MNSASQRILIHHETLLEAAAGCAADRFDIGRGSGRSSYRQYCSWRLLNVLVQAGSLSVLQHTATQLHILPWVVTQMWVLQPRHGAYPYLSKKVVTVVVVLISESCAHIICMLAATWKWFCFSREKLMDSEWRVVHEFLSWIARGMRGKRSSGHH
jgi:hypothetical protein